MMIIGKKKDGYLVHRFGKSNEYALCKILCEYKSEQELRENLLKLLSHQKTEEELLNDYSKIDILK